MEADRVDELIAGHALHALSEEDERELEQHLRRSPEARERLSALEETAAALAHGVDAPPPPPGLRARILDEARATGRPSNVVSLRRRWVVPVLAAATAAAAGVAIGLGIWGSNVSSSLSKEREAAARQAEAVAVLANPDSSRYPVSGASGTLVVAPSGDAALALSGFEPAPEGKTYEVWVIDGEKPAPAGLFDGGGSPLVALTRPVPAGATVAVTVERAGGVDAPTSEPIVLAPTV
jgi:anti-sigma-K factor RskA